ncbi:MAG: hypothetical protein M3R38_16635 [Actinomycetota bacterium]|nr:hypothetical protein [Actinomycetota bacterium]
MEIKNVRLRELQGKAEAAGRRFEEGKKRLYKNGKQLFSDEVHREELDKLARERNAVLFEVEEEARELRAGAVATLERVEHADPAALLSDEELSRANARRGFANDQADSLRVEDLLKRLSSVLHGGDRAAIFAYLLAGQRRRQAILERRRERSGSFASGPGPGVPPSGATAAGSSGGTPLDGVLEEMHKALGGEKLEAELEAARVIGQEAFEVEFAAADIRHQGQGAYLPTYAVPGPSGEAVREVARLARVR